MMHRLVSLLCICLTFSGCLGPYYHKPCLDIPECWRLGPTEGDTLCNLRWWEEFEDPVLDALIMTALANNQDLQVAISRVLEYYARLAVAKAPLLPFIDLDGSGQRAQTSLLTTTGGFPGIARTSNTFTGFFNLSWEMDFWGRIRSASAAACADLLAQTEARRAVVLTVVSSVADAYFTLRGLDEQLEISRKTLKSRKDSLQLAQDRFHLGETSLIEVKQAEAEVESAAIRMIEFERDIPQQENILSALVGENPREICRGRNLNDFPLELDIPTGIPSDVLTRRPDIMQAEDSLMAADARICEARALFFPQISLTGQYGYQSETLVSFLTNPAQMWQYGFSLLQPLFHGGEIYYRFQETIAFRDQALHNYCETILTAFKEVENALIAYSKNRELVKEHKIQVKVLKEYLQLAQLRYAEGEIDYLNVLDAERLLFDAQLAQAQARIDSLNAAVGLYAALGGGWVTDADGIAITDTFYDSETCCQSTGQLP